MTLAVVFKGPEGLVLAVDSRVTLETQMSSGQRVSSYFDNATKLLSIQGQPYVGIVTYGMGVIGQAQPRTAHGFIPEFETQLSTKYPERTNVIDVARELGDFYTEQWKQAKMPITGAQSMVFLVAGFDDREAYGKVYEVQVPSAPTPAERNPGESFGLTWGGQSELVTRIMNGVDQQAIVLAKAELRLTDAQERALLKQWTQLSLPIPWQFLPLQDCVDLSAFLVNMTSAVQTWTVGVRGVGGAVDVATITRTEGFRAIKQKRIEVWE